MKRCDRCGNENADQMQFCLQCGNVLPNAPIVVNLQNDPARKPIDAKTDSFNQSVATQVGFNRNTQSGYSAPTSNKPGGGKGKIFLAVGGILALLLLFFIAVAAIVAYNFVSNQKVQVSPTPTPVPVRTTEKNSPSPTPASKTTPKVTPTEQTTTDDTTDNYPNVTVEFDNIDVDYNVRNGKQLGMRMRVNFTVNGMKDTDAYLAIHFQTKDDTKLSAKPGIYRDVNGNLAAFKTLKPDYEETDYKDLELFLPYDEFKLPAGRHELKMDIDLLDGKGVLVKHMAFEDFWYENK